MDTNKTETINLMDKSLESGKAYIQITDKGIRIVKYYKYYYKLDVRI
ncbi:MAG: hypothetical protein R2942_00785 [Ignavibacteria bacterium]